MPRKIAIACQGGGSHAAFAAGALHELLQDKYAPHFDIVALSGTSGGAACAALAWSGLLRGGRALARELLDSFWHELMATPRNLMDMACDFWGQVFARLLPTFKLSPYSTAELCAPALQALLRKHVRLEEIRRLPPERLAHPILFIGATDVLSGARVVTGGDGLTYDDLLASAAIPTLFRAVHTRGSLFWDGLFSTNPPIRQFTDVADPDDKPDEIWAIRINPHARKREPRSLHDILDRRNELSGNLSMDQELVYIQKINDLLAQFPALRQKYKHIDVRIIEIADTLNLDHASKLDRSPSLIEHLLSLGRQAAPQLLASALPPSTPAAKKTAPPTPKPARPKPAPAKPPRRRVAR